MKLTKEQLLLMVQTFAQNLITLGFEKFEVITVSENARFGSSEDPSVICLKLVAKKIDATVEFLFKSNPEVGNFGYLFDINWQD